MFSISNSLITRNGIINLKGAQVHNQCVNQENDIFRYELKILFSPNIRLDKSGFIIDHKLFDQTVQKVQINSCEIMSAQILDSITQLLHEHNLECICIKLKLQPGFATEENSAYFQEYRCHKESDLAIAMNL